MSHPKDIRKQVRNVVQEILSEVLTSELVSSAKNTITLELEAKLKERLDGLEVNINKMLKQQNERARAVQGFLVQTAMQEVNSQMYNMHVTMLAWQDLMSANMGDVAEFQKKLDAKKAEISEQLQKEKEAKMAERIKSEEKPAEAAAPVLEAVPPADAAPTA